MTSDKKEKIAFYLHITKADLKVYSPFILLMINAIWGTYAFKYIESNVPEQIAFKRFLIPALTLSAFYAYYSVIRRSSLKQLWKKILLIISFVVIFTVLFLLAFKSIIILWNGYVGTHKPFKVIGTVKSIKYPKRKGLLSTYTTSILTNSTDSTLSFDITGKEYIIGEIFDKQMAIGSLGFLYCDK